MPADDKRTSISLKELLQVCGNLGVCAGEILREVHQSRVQGGKEGLKMIDKGAAHGKAFDPQTVADRRSERMIVDGLRRAFGPDLCIVGEESGLAPSKKRDEEAEQQDDDDVDDDDGKVRDRIRLQDSWTTADNQQVDLSRVSVWIDPLDATREYTEGHVQFCTVLIGVALDGRSTAGVIVEPFACLDEQVCWWGVKGQGCFRTTVHEDICNNVTVPVVLSTNKQHVRIAVSRGRVGGVVQQFTSRYTSYLAARNVSFDISFSGGCGHKILLVLKNKADLYPFPCSGTSMWDSCAGDALLDAAGGLLTDKHGRRLVFDPKSASFENVHGILASNDASKCHYASDTIAVCLEYTRTLNFDFFSDEYLQTVLQEPRVMYFETPASSLHRRNGLTEFTLVATCSTNHTRTLQYRRFDPSPFFLDNSDDGDMARTLAKRASEAYFLAEILPQVEKDSRVCFSATIKSLERTTAFRRPGNVYEVLSKFRSKSLNKLFLQSLAFVSLTEAREDEGDSFEMQVSFLRAFHDFFWNNPTLADKISENGWRWTRSPASSTTPAKEEGEYCWLGAAKDAFFKARNKRVPSDKHLWRPPVAAGRDEEEEEEGDDDDDEDQQQRRAAQSVQQRMDKFSGLMSSSSSSSASSSKQKYSTTVIRGLWTRSPRSLDDVTYCTAVLENASEPRLAHLQDLAHLLLVTGVADASTSFGNLATLKRVYFDLSSKDDDAALNKQLKMALFRYCRNIIPSPVFAEAFSDARTQAHVLRVAEVLCNELDMRGELDGTNLECFGIVTPLTVSHQVARM